MVIQDIIRLCCLHILDTVRVCIVCIHWICTNINKLINVNKIMFMSILATLFRPSSSIILNLNLTINCYEKT